MFGPLTPITKNIIILNVLVYLVANFLKTPDLYQYLSAYYPFSPNFHSWQILTHMFMHAPFGQGIGLSHILFNMLTLYSFGPVLERTLGEKKYLILYFIGGLGAFILFNIWNYYEIHQLASNLSTLGYDTTELFRKAAFNYGDEVSFPNLPEAGYNDAKQLFLNLRTPMLGASGAIFGVVAAFSTLFPNAKLFFMIIPIPIKAKYLLPLIIAVSLYLGFSDQMSGVAHFAHIGGALVGFLYALNWKKKQQGF